MREDKKGCDTYTYGNAHTSFSSGLAALKFVSMPSESGEASRKGDTSNCKETNIYYLQLSMNILEV